MNMVERIARAAADGLGDDYDSAFANKSEWVAARGEKGGRFRDANEPYQDDYIAAALAMLKAMRDPTPGMVEAGDDANLGDEWDSVSSRVIMQAMIDTAIAEHEGLAAATLSPHSDQPPPAP